MTCDEQTTPLAAVQAGIGADVAQGAPIVVHAVVALCDNVNQGIVPVPAAVGNGQDPGSNLYWGALYEFRTYLARTAGWSAVADLRPRDSRILERRVFRAGLRRGGGRYPSTSLPTPGTGRTSATHCRSSCPWPPAPTPC